MKKLMIALAMVAVAACAQATTVKWKVSGVTPTGTDEDTTGYLMVCLMSADTTDAAAAKLLSTTDAASYASKKDATNLTKYQLTTTTLNDEGGKTSSAVDAYKNAWIAEQGNPQSGDFYAVIFNAESIADATAYMLIDPVTVGYGSSATTSKTATLSASTWVDISDTPEPTSGLLLLLGVAGLALKRKCA